MKVVGSMSLPVPAEMWDTPEHADSICAAALGRR